MIGHQAHKFNSTGGNNTVIGAFAGNGVTANSNSNNLFLGYSTGSNVTTGSSNILIGYDVDLSVATVSNELNIGGFITGTIDDGTLLITSQNAATVPLTVKGAAAQSGSMLEIQNDGSTVLTKIDHDGTALFQNDTDSVTAYQFSNAAGTVIANVDTVNGRVGAGTAAPITTLHADSNAANTVAIQTLENTAGDFQIFGVDATPEAAVTGSIGDLAIDRTGGKMYIKNSGSATNTGWAVLGGIPAFKSYTLTDTGTADTHYVAGFYDAPAAAATLTIGGTVTQTYGTAGRAKGGHAFAVASGAGGTDLVLTVTGISITDGGVRNDSDSEVIVADTDTATTDAYYETDKKWLGQVTYTLSGAAGAFTFNYGFTKYEDFGNRDFTVTDFETVIHGGTVSETGFDFQLLHHKSAGWTYSAGAFVPGTGAVVSSLTDYSATNDNLTSNMDAAYKRAGMSTDVAGATAEGIIVKVVTSSNN